MKTFLIPFFVTVICLMTACSDDPRFDATGTFEAEEIVISAEVAGVIKTLNLEEGQTLAEGAFVGYIDSVQLFLKKKQLDAQVKAVLSKRPDVDIQLAHLRQQLEIARREKTRVSNLVKGDAATSKQLDEVEHAFTLLQR